MSRLLLEIIKVLTCGSTIRLLPIEIHLFWSLEHQWRYHSFRKKGEVKKKELLNNPGTPAVKSIPEAAWSLPESSQTSISSDLERVAQSVSHMSSWKISD